MKSDKKRLQEYIRQIVKSYLYEAEKEEGGKDEGGEENPFAAGEGGGEDAAAGGEEEKPADDKEGGEKKDKAAEQPAGVPIKFDVSKVKKYNDANFLSDSGVVKSISKKGVVVTVEPDQVDVLVNFDDISENVKKFFKARK